MKTVLKPARSDLCLDTSIALAGIALLPNAASAQEGVMAQSAVKGNPTAVCGHLVYVANSYSSTLSVIDLSDNHRVENLPTGEAPVNPTRERLLSANIMRAFVSTINTRRITQPILSCVFVSKSLAS